MPQNAKASIPQNASSTIFFSKVLPLHDMMVNRKKGRCNGLNSQQDQTSIQRNAPFFILGIIRCWVPDMSRCRARSTVELMPTAQLCESWVRPVKNSQSKTSRSISPFSIARRQYRIIASVSMDSRTGVRAGLLSAAYRSPSVSVSKVYFYNPSPDNWHISFYNSKSLLHHCDCTFSRH